MAENNGRDEETKPTISSLSIEKELKTSFLDYAMSVIVSRALPDVRDGLKPVHRRIIYAMHGLGLYNERGYRKSATVVGEVIGHFHPHGDQAIYQTMVGLAQDFSKRYPLLDGQGNWGSVDGDNAAAMRYTEVKMAKIARQILTDIEKDTVDFIPNFDESNSEPVILPSRLPQLIVNGSNGIAVGMATNIPPHNLGEVLDACVAMVKNPDITEDEIFALIPAPDLPGGGIICGRAGILQGYRTGHGSVKVRGVVDIDEEGSRPQLIIREIPYQVNKSDLIANIVNLVKDKVCEGIVNIRDESNRDGIRVIIELKRGEIPQVILNKLYKHTQLEKSLSMILLALLNGRPILFTLREMLEQFILHRRAVITRRTNFELKKNRAREHILNGLLIALENIDPIVLLIKKAPSSEAAMNGLKEKFKLSDIQAKAILDMRLQKLTGFEQEKLHGEISAVLANIAELRKILEDPEVFNNIMLEEFEQIRHSFADKRRTKIEAGTGDLNDIDLIPNDEVVITLTQKGYVKRVKLDSYAVQHRGGKGKKGTADLAESGDSIKDIFVTKNHDDLFFFTSKGRVYSMKVFQIPEASRTARGRAIVNLLPLTEGETVVKLLCINNYENKFLVMVTKGGVIKKTAATAFQKVRSTGIYALTLRENDELAFCGLSTGNSSIVLATSAGQGIRFNESEVRAMGRQAAGVRGITLRDGATVVGMELSDDDCELLFSTSNGYGKRVLLSEFRVAHRGGLGVRTIPVNKRNGEVIGMVRVSLEATILLIDKNGKIIRLDPKEIRTMRRGAQGVRLIRLDKGQKLASVVSFESLDEDDQEEVTKMSDDSQAKEGDAPAEDALVDEAASADTTQSKEDEK